MKKLALRPAAVLALLTSTILTAPFASAQTAWIGANNVSASTNWSENLNWSTLIAPGASDVVRFHDDGIASPGEINNVVDALFGGTIASLQYANTNGSHTTFIPPGVTLNIGGDLIAGTGTANDITGIFNTITGEQGTLVAGGGFGNLTVRQWPVAGTSSANRTTLDMSGLGTFNANVARVLVGVSVAGGANRSSGQLLLARTNIITASGGTPAINIGESAANNGNGSNVRLGQTNAIFANTITVGRYKERGVSLAFNPIFDSPSLFMRAGDGVSRITTFAIADGGTGSATVNPQGTVDLSLGTVNIEADTIQVARTTSNATAITGTQQADGILTFNAGVIDVNTLQLGLHTTAAGRNAVGTVNVNSTALLRVNLALELGRATGGAGTDRTRGVLNVTGGTVHANQIDANFGGTNNVINLLNGTLVVTNNIGPGINSFTMNDSTLTVPTVVGGASVIVTNLVLDGTANVINVSSISVIASYPAQFTLIKYVGTLGGAFNAGLGTLPASSPAFAGYLSNNVANSSIDVIITSGPQPARIISWNGLPNGNWDTATANWRFLGSGTVFNQEDFVRFDDTASGTTAVSLNGTLLPSSITVSNNTKTYGFGGNGSLSGATGITKDGSGTLFITNNAINDFTGTLSINAGSVRIGDGATAGNLGSGSIANNGALAFNRVDEITVSNAVSGTGTLAKQGAGTVVLAGANTYSGTTTVTDGTLRTLNSGALGTAAGGTTINSGSTLDIGANTINLGQEPITVSGAGVGGAGAIVNSSGSATFVGPNVARVTLTGNTVLGGTGRWDLRSANTADPAGASLSTGGQPLSVTKLGGNQITVVGVTVDPALGNVDIQEGILGFETATTSLGNPASNLIVRAGAQLRFHNSTNFWNKQFQLFGDGLNASLWNNAGANTVIGPMALNDSVVVNVIGTSLTLSNQITGNASLSKNGTANLILSGNAAHAGGTTVNAGTLTVDGTHASGVTNVLGTTLGGSGTVNGMTDSSGTFSPGTLAGAGTFTAAGGIVFQGGPLRFNLNTNNTTGSGINDLLQITGDLNANFPSVEVTMINGRLAAGNYRLINYTGALVGGLTAPANLGRYNFTLDTATAHQVNLNVTGAAGRLTWNAVNNSASWDVGGSQNWLNAGNAPDVFFDADDVRFTDVPGVSNTVALDAIVMPLTVTNNSGTTDYTITGVGRISGAASIVKLGDSTLTLATTNDFTGPVSIQAGTIKVSNNGALGALPGGAATILPGATLDLGGNPTANNANYGAKQINVSGAGVGGGGAIINSGAVSQQNAFQRVTLTGDATFGGPGDAAATGNPGRWDIRGGTPTLELGGFTLTKVGDNQFTLVGATVSGGNIVVNDGLLSAETTTTFTGSGNITVNPEGTLGHFRNGPEMFNRPVTLNGGIIRNVATTAPGTTNAAPITLIADSTLQGSTTAGYPITFTGAIGSQGGAFGITKTGAGSVILTGTSTYTGNTLINIGSLELHGTATIGNSANIFITAGTTLNVANRTDGTLTLNSGQTLAGDGTVAGRVSAGTGSTISPGTTPGTLTATGNITFQPGSTARMELSKDTLASDQLRAIGAAATTITYDGTLALVNLDSALAAGDSFQLFVATNYAGAFDNLVPATPGPGLAWDTTELTNGVLRVVAGGPAAQISGVEIVGGNIVLSGANGPAGAEYRVLTSTNIALPLSSWLPIATNSFDVTGAFRYTNGAASGPQRYYILQLP